MATIPPLAPASLSEVGRSAAPAAKVSAQSASQTARARKAQDAFQQFEAFVVQSFISEMLPKNATTVFGSGTAGEVWRSMLAEKLAAEIARSGRLGIAQRVAAGAGAQAPAVSSVPAPTPVMGGGWAAAVSPEADATSSEPSGDHS